MGGIPEPFGFAQDKLRIAYPALAAKARPGWGTPVYWFRAASMPDSIGPFPNAKSRQTSLF